MRHSRNEIREPEIADYFFGRELILSPLKTVPIEDGQYRFEAFVAVGDGENYIGLGQRCGKDRKSAEQFAFRKDNRNIIKVKKSWLTPVTGCYEGVTVQLYPHAQLIARPMVRRILATAGLTCCRVEVNCENDSQSCVSALPSFSKA